MIIKDRKELTAGSKVLTYLLEAQYYHRRIMDRTRLSSAVYPEYSKYKARARLNSLMFKLKQKGWIHEEYQEGKRISELTKHGELEALFVTMHIVGSAKSWDGKWRLVIFDIPEAASGVRQRLRLLLKGIGFRALQASVYINPYPISRAAIDYLNKSGLIRYIRVLRVDEIDNAKDLYMMFQLSKSVHT